MITKQQYLLVCLMEECAEVQQIASKCLRFGFKDHHPQKYDSNMMWLYKELNDIYAVVEMIWEELGMPMTPNKEEIETKKNKVLKYLKYSKKLGTTKETPK